MYRLHHLNQVQDNTIQKLNEQKISIHLDHERHVIVSLTWVTIIVHSIVESPGPAAYTNVQ